MQARYLHEQDVAAGKPSKPQPAGDVRQSEGRAQNRSLAAQFRETRRLSVAFCEPLQIEDYNLQAVAETSPPKWHLAHTTWFFETFILKPFLDAYQPQHPQYEYLFNSYYNGIGQQYPRPHRGLLSRPSVDEVLAYRQSIDEQILVLLADVTHPHRAAIEERVELGVHHEQQHQELFFTDIKYSFSFNPLNPQLVPQTHSAPIQTIAFEWHEYDGGLVSVGSSGDAFCFDNETPRHRVFVEPFALANRLSTNREYLAFMEAGGYQRPELWLADGWASAQAQRWEAPLYWRQQGGEWCEYTLHGLRPLDLDQPVCHLSAYEADAFARWSGARLPTEFEWEYVAQQLPIAGQFVDSGHYQPAATSARNLQHQGPQQMFGTLWEWTSSAYSPYPGFKPVEGAIGEYNGKFMCNQLVLRGGSCVSSASHLRASYRNFFYPPDRWQFTGVRLARS